MKFMNKSKFLKVSYLGTQHIHISFNDVSRNLQCGEKIILQSFAKNFN